MAQESITFLVEGCALRFDKDITGHFKRVTRAVSEKKAIQNVLYNIKRDMGLEPTVKMVFKGTVTQLA